MLKQISDLITSKVGGYLFTLLPVAVMVAAIRQWWLGRDALDVTVLALIGALVILAIWDLRSQFIQRKGGNTRAIYSLATQRLILVGVVLLAAVVFYKPRGENRTPELPSDQTLALALGQAKIQHRQLSPPPNGASFHTTLQFINETVNVSVRNDQPGTARFDVLVPIAPKPQTDWWNSLGQYAQGNVIATLQGTFLASGIGVSAESKDGAPMIRLTSATAANELTPFVLIAELEKMHRATNVLRAGFTSIFQAAATP